MALALTGQTQTLPAAAAATGTAPAAAAAGTAPSTAAVTSLLSMRVKRIDPNEVKAILAQAQKAAIQQEQTQLQAAQMQAAQSQQGAGTSPTAAAADAAAGAAAAQNQAAAVRVADRVSASQAATAAPSAAQRSNSLAIAPRHQDDYWTTHIAQFKGKFLPDGPAMRPNCGPASVTMALRMIGKDVPGFNGQRSEAVLDKARIIATGKNDITVGTTDTELERVITAAGARWSESNNLNEMLGWVQQGIPVIMSGNPARGWDSRYTPDQVYPFDGGHWVTVSGYDAKTGFYIVNDPLSQIGPIEVSAQELANYNSSHGGLGIAVFN